MSTAPMAPESSVFDDLESLGELKDNGLIVEFRALGLCGSYVKALQMEGD